MSKQLDQVRRKVNNWRKKPVVILFIPLFLAILAMPLVRLAQEGKEWAQTSLLVFGIVLFIVSCLSLLNISRKKTGRINN